MSDAIDPVTTDTTSTDATTSDAATLQTSFLDMVVEIGSMILQDQITDLASEANDT